MSSQRFDTAGPGRVGAARRAAAHSLRVLSWAVAPAWVVVATRGGLLAAVSGTLAVVSAAFAWWYRRFLADYAASLAVAAHGAVEVTPDQLVLHHPGVLAEVVPIPWAHVRAVVVDTGAGAAGDGEAAGGGPAVPDRFVLPGGGEGPGPGGTAALFAGSGGRRARRRPGIPLLAARPVVPDVLVLLDPPVALAWRYPFIAGPFNPPRGDPWPARPWAGPAPTPAFLVALSDPEGFAAAARERGRLRPLEPRDVEFLGAHGLLG